MQEHEEISLFWFRRDLRLEDNIGLNNALQSGYPVVPLFIFDEEIIGDLPKNDARVSFIYQTLNKIHLTLKSYHSSLLIKKGNVEAIFSELTEKYTIKQVFFNRDYEPYALQRDERILKLLTLKGITTKTYKDHVIFESNELLKEDGTPYTVYTPYKNKWLRSFLKIYQKNEQPLPLATSHFYPFETIIPTLEFLGLIKSKQKVKPPNLDIISTYEKDRDFPARRGTSLVSPHLRFGTLSIRQLVKMTHNINDTYLNELIWREFFIQILVHFPRVITQNFKPVYDHIQWRNEPGDFERWCSGNTGYPMVDAGMRQLNKTGYMHNRVRMITASFLCKHLLIDWRMGEAYFAKKLLDYELSSNNGNWQWAAGTGCDAAPYFRIFNPQIQLKKFDSKGTYVKKWIPELNESYCKPIVEHKFARERALETYKKGLQK
ncbi:DNA photolyase family protein [Flavobacteriaceae bacterium F08102]|nr:DNA photolyase family protein [Flavobacteriaceae bacterium F08102]